MKSVGQPTFIHSLVYTRRPNYHLRFSAVCFFYNKPAFGFIWRLVLQQFVSTDLSLLFKAYESFSRKNEFPVIFKGFYKNNRFSEKVNEICPSDCMLYLRTLVYFAVLSGDSTRKDVKELKLKILSIPHNTMPHQTKPHLASYTLIFFS